MQSFSCNFHLPAQGMPLQWCDPQNMFCFSQLGTFAPRLRQLWRCVQIAAAYLAWDLHGQTCAFGKHIHAHMLARTHTWHITGWSSSICLHAHGQGLASKWNMSKDEDTGSGNINQGSRDDHCLTSEPDDNRCLRNNNSCYSSGSRNSTHYSRVISV